MSALMETLMIKEVDEMPFFIKDVVMLMEAQGTQHPLNTSVCNIPPPSFFEEVGLASPRPHQSEAAEIRYRTCMHWSSRSIPRLT